MAKYQRAETFCEVTYDSDLCRDDYDADDRYLTPYRYSLHKNEIDSNLDNASFSLPSFTYYEYLRALYDCRTSASCNHGVPHGYPGSIHSGVEAPVRAGTWHDFDKQTSRLTHSEPPKTRPTFPFSTLHLIQQRQAVNDDYEDEPPTERTSREKLVWVDALDKWIPEIQLQHRPYMSFVANPPVADKPRPLTTPRERHMRLLHSAPGCRRDIVAYISLTYTKALTTTSCSLRAEDMSEICPCARHEMYMYNRVMARQHDRLINKQRNEDKREAIRRRSQEIARQRRQRKAYSTPLYTSLTLRKQKVRGPSGNLSTSMPVSARPLEKTPQDVKPEVQRPPNLPATPVKREKMVKLVSPKPADVNKEADKKVTFVDSDKGAKKKPKQKKVEELDEIAGGVGDDLLDVGRDSSDTFVEVHIDINPDILVDGEDCNNNNSARVDEARLAELRLQAALEAEREKLAVQQQQRLLEEQQEEERRREVDRRRDVERQREIERRLEADRQREAVQLEADRRRTQRDAQLQLRTQTRSNEAHYNGAMNAAASVHKPTVCDTSKHHHVTYNHHTRTYVVDKKPRTGNKTVKNLPESSRKLKAAVHHVKVETVKAEVVGDDVRIRKRVAKLPNSIAMKDNRQIPELSSRRTVGEIVVDVEGEPLAPGCLTEGTVEDGGTGEAVGGNRRKGKGEKTLKVKPSKTGKVTKVEKSELTLKHDNMADNKPKTKPQRLAMAHVEGKQKGVTKSPVGPVKVPPPPKPVPVVAPKPMLVGVSSLPSQVPALSPAHRVPVREEKLLITTPNEVENEPEQKPKSPEPRRGWKIVKKERLARVCVNKDPKEPEPPPPPEVNTKTDAWIFGEDDFTETQEVVVDKPPVDVVPIRTFIGDLNPELIEAKKDAQETRRKKVIEKLSQTENSVPRWKKLGQSNRSYQDDQHQTDLAEERRRKQMKMYNRIKSWRMSIFDSHSSESLHNFEDYGFLAKYCIFNNANMDMYRNAFDAVDEYHKGFLEGEDVMIALRGANHRLTEDEEEYLYRVLELTGYKIINGADFKMFSVLAALSQRITALDKWMKNMIGNMDFKTLEMKLFLCKTLWECNVDQDTNKITIDQVCVDLRAGGVSFEHELEVREKLAHLTALDLLDFLTYIPLFIMIHESVVQNPLDDTRSK